MRFHNGVFLRWPKPEYTPAAYTHLSFSIHFELLKSSSKVFVSHVFSTFPIWYWCAYPIRLVDILRAREYEQQKHTTHVLVHAAAAVADVHHALTFQ